MNHLILCRPLLLLSIFPSIRIFSNESALGTSCPKYRSFSFSISVFNEYSGLISFRIDWFDLPAVQGTFKSRVFPNITVQKHQFFGGQPSLWSSSHILLPNISVVGCTPVTIMRLCIDSSCKCPHLGDLLDFDQVVLHITYNQDSWSEMG